MRYELGREEQMSKTEILGYFTLREQRTEKE